VSLPAKVVYVQVQREAVPRVAACVVMCKPSTSRGSNVEELATVRDHPRLNHNNNTLPTMSRDVR